MTPARFPRAPRLPASRLALAALLMAIGLALPLVAFFVASRAQVRRAQDALLDDARQRTQQEETRLAAELAVRLEALREGESKRPYYHYQRLYHDPGAVDQGASLVPSPLAAPPADPLVWAYLQIGVDGAMTTPLVDPAPDAQVDPSARRTLDVLRAAQGDVARVTEERHGALAQIEPAQEQILGQGAYYQNTNAMQVYADLKGRKGNPESTAGGEVVVSVEALQWSVLQIDGAPALVATRGVSTPSGRLVQGLVLEADALQRALSRRGTLTLATLSSSTASISASGAPVPIVLRQGAISVAVAPPDEATLDAQRSAIGRAFLVQFVPVSAVALLAGAAVLLVVAQSERLARQRSAFAASAAHELRTPLAGLRIYAEMLADGLGDPDASQRYARRIADESARLGRVVSNMLGFTRLERGALVVQPRPGDLAAVLREEVERLAPTLHTLGATLVEEIAVERDDDAAACVFDRDAVVQIVHNLVDNAEKYTRGAADRTIVVKLAREGAPARCVVSVEDPGVGVDVALRDKLFHPFERGASPDAAAGIGLGLSLSRALARAQGGELVHAPAAGGGSVFTLTLPCAPSREAPKGAR